MNKVALWSGVGGLVILLALTFAYGFRTKTEDNPALGTLYFKYRFWKPSSVSVDSNNDGKINATGYLVKGANDFSDSFREYREDRNFDGHFEIWASFEDGILDYVEIDTDGDGTPEEVHEGEEAAKDFFLLFVREE